MADAATKRARAPPAETTASSTMPPRCSTSPPTASSPTRKMLLGNGEVESAEEGDVAVVNEAATQAGANGQ